MALSDRDFFAASALAGLIAYPGTSDEVMEPLVEKAFRYADMMLKRREQGKPEPVKPENRSTR